MREKLTFPLPPDQTEAVAVLLEALLLCQLHEESRQEVAKGRRMGSIKWGVLAQGGWRRAVVGTTVGW